MLLLFTAAVAVAALKPGMVPGASMKLTPRLQQLSTAAFRAQPLNEQARRLGLSASGPASLIRIGDEVVVTARVSSTDASITQALRDAGAQIQVVSARYGMITMAVAPSALERVAGVAGVRSVSEELTPMTSGFPSAGCPWGAFRSEADTQLRAADARAAFGVAGTGVKVGIIADSLDARTDAVTHLADDVFSDDLPGATNHCGYLTAVQNLNDPYWWPVGAGPLDEGRAMAQVLHDLAPGASLAFATSWSGLTDAITRLRGAGAKVIVDDFTWYDEPFFQDGPYAVSANEAAAAGIAYFSDAANSNVIDRGNNVSSWEAPAFRPTTCYSALAAYNDYGKCMNFDPSGIDSNPLRGITVSPRGHFTLDLQWNEPWYGVQTDLDAFVLNADGTINAKSIDFNPSYTQKPFEALYYENTAEVDQRVYIAIGKWSSASPGDPRVKYVLSGNPRGIKDVGIPGATTGVIVGPAIFGHNGTSGAMSMAAVPYDNSSAVEAFSSRGPVTHYYGPVTGTTPASPLSSPEVLAKPDAAATDGAATTFFGDYTMGVYRFYGTSAAAPHAAAIAALMRQLNPTASVKQIYGALRATAVAVGSFGAEAAGHGLLNAVGALGQIAPPKVTQVIPNAGPTTGGNTVTINGSRFKPGSVVRFGSVASSSVTFVSATQLKAVVPAHAAGVVQVTVNTTVGSSSTSNASLYAYGIPTLTKLTPNAGLTAGGNTVTITGSRFVPGATVRFGPTASPSVSFVASNQVKAVAPAHAAGLVDVTVATAAGSSPIVVADRYRYE